MRKNILIYCELDSTSAPRVHKQIKALSNNYNVFLASHGFAKTNDYKNLNFIQLTSQKGLSTAHYGYNVFFRKIVSVYLRLNSIIKRILRGELNLSKQERHFWNHYENSHYTSLKNLKIDLLICHHVSSLPLGFKLKNKFNCPIIMNAHEFYPLQFEHKPRWMKNIKPIIDFTCKKFLPQLDDMFCVGHEIGKTYIRDYGLKSYTLVKNDKPYHLCKPSATEDKIRIIHHGGCIRGRSLEETVQLAKLLDPEKYHVYLMLVETDKEYFQELQKAGENIVNLTFLPIVDYEEIIPFSNQFDIGLFLLPPKNFNYLNALPNKLFEYIQAKLCICISPNPEMKRLVEEFQLGLVSEDYSAEQMAATITQLSKDQINRFKSNCATHSQTLSSEQTEAAILRQVTNLLSSD